MNTNKFPVGAFAFIGLGILAILAFWGTVGYVALHFVSKFW